MEAESGEQVGSEFVSVPSSGGCFVQGWLWVLVFRATCINPADTIRYDTAILTGT